MEILSSIGGCFHQVAVLYGLPLSLFLAGLVGSTTHCVFMCGPFVVSQTGDMHKMRDLALIPYHLGRMTSYIFMTIMAYAVFSLVFVYSDIKALIAAPLLFLAGVIFLVSAFPQLRDLFPWVSRIGLAVPLGSIQRKYTKLFQQDNVFSRYGLGVLLGFMPCGLVIAALIASLTAGSIWGAIIAMMAFTAGTIPALILVAMGTSGLVQKYPKFSLHFSQIAKVISALWLFALATTMIL